MKVLQGVVGAVSIALCLPVCLGAGIEIRGAVLGDQGQPVPEARVALFDAAAVGGQLGTEPAAEAITDGQGRYRLSAPRAGLWSLRVSAPGYVPASMDFLPLLGPVHPEPVRLKSDAGLVVRVRDEKGQPVPGARVLLEPGNPSRFFSRERAWHGAPRAGLSDTEGRARLARARGESAALSVSAPGRALAEVPQVRGGVSGVRLAAGRPVTLRLREPSGAPSAGVFITGGEQNHPLGRTDEEGRLTIHVPFRRPFSVLARSAGGARVETTIPAGTEPGKSELVLPAPPTIEGKVLDAETRHGIGGAFVWDGRHPLGGSVTEGRGEFRLKVPSAGIIDLRAAAAGYLPGRIWRGTVDRALDRGPVLALSPGASVEGLVVDEAGRAVSEAAVSLTVRQPHDGMMRIELGGPKSEASTFSGEDGRFTLSAVDPSHDYDLHVRREGFTPARQALSGLKPYESVRGLRIALTAGLTATGSVTDSEGGALPDAEVVFSPSAAAGPGGMMTPGASPPPAGKAESDKEGVYTVEHLPPGSFDLEVSRPGFATVRLRGVSLDDEQATTRLDPIRMEPSTPVEGWVLDPQGEPVEGAGVAVTAGMNPLLSLGPSPSSPDALTGPDGWFRIDGHRAGEKVDLSISHGGYTSAKKDGIALPLADPLEVTLTPASTVSGSVLDTEGEPIADAQVNLSRTVIATFGRQSMAMMTQISTDTDREGRFSFEDVDPGKIFLEGTAEGHQKSMLGNIEVPQGEDVTGIELRLTTGATVAGQVLQADGRPAIGARISPIGVETGPVRYSRMETDGEGWYHLDGLAPGAVTIEARNDSGGRAVRDAELEPGLNRVDLQFEGGYSVEGFVLDESGAAVAGAWVRLSPAGKPWSGQDKSAGPDGSFRFEGIQPGSYTLQARAEGLAPPAELPVVEVADRPVTGVEVRLGAAGVIVGTVSGLDERELPDVRVTAFHTSGRQVEEAVVDHEGRFRIEDLIPGRWSLRGHVGSGGRQAEAEAVVEPGGAEAVANLEFGGGVTLTGVALQSDRPVSQAVINLTGESVSTSGWSRTDDEGRFSIEGLEPGRYRLDLHQWKTGLRYGEKIELSGDQEITLEIPAGRITGRVIDALTREEIEGATITLEATGAGALPGMLSDLGSTSDAEGNFSIAPVTDGEWRLRAQRKGYAAESRLVTVQGGDALQEIRLELQPTEGLVLDVSTGAGQFPSEVRVCLLDAGGGVVLSGEYATGEGGRVRLSGAPAGSWTLLAGASGLATLQQQVSAPGPPVPLRLGAASTLEIARGDFGAPDAPLTITIRDARGIPFQSLSWLGQPVSTWRLRSGPLRLDDLPAGSWTITAETPTGDRHQEEATTTAGQTTLVTLGRPAE